MDRKQFVVHCTDHKWSSDADDIEHFAVKENGCLEVASKCGVLQVYSSTYWLKIEDQDSIDYPAVIGSL